MDRIRGKMDRVVSSSLKNPSEVRYGREDSIF